jgi:6-phosphogluconolactonase
LTLLNQVSSGGGGPTYIVLDKTGRTLVAANFGSGRTTAVRVLLTGKLGEQTASMNETGSGPHRRQASAHAHAVLRSPDNRFMLVPDFGADKVYVFRFNAVTGTLTTNDPPMVSLPPGSGPRQMAFHISGKYVYLLNELSANITVYAWHPREGTLSEIQTLSALASPAKGEPSAAGIVMHPNGRFLLTTTRSDNAVESFAIDEASGKLTMRDHVPSGGDQPWSCALGPTGSHLAVTNFGSNSVSIFRIDAAKGTMKLTGEPLSAPSPVCAAFVRV